MIKSPLHRFKQAIRKREPHPADLRLRKDAVTTVEAVDDRVVRFVVSTPVVDRDLDTVSVEGWDLASYRRNPVVLWGHDSDSLPIGKCTSIFVAEGKLKADVEFVPADMPMVGPMAEAVLRMCRTGFLSATSVGFRPLEWKLTDDPARGAEDWLPGIDFTRQELMEFSVVSIPCNPEALIDGVPASGEVSLSSSPDAVKAVRQKVLARLATKGLYDISSLASILGELGWLHDSLSWQAEGEADPSQVPAKLGEAMRILGDALVSMTGEEVSELLARVTGEQERSAIAARRKQRQRDALLVGIG